MILPFASVVQMVSLASDSRNPFDFCRGLDGLVGQGSAAIFFPLYKTGRPLDLVSPSYVF